MRRGCGWVLRGDRAGRQHARPGECHATPGRPRRARAGHQGDEVDGHLQAMGDGTVTIGTLPLISASGPTALEIGSARTGHASEIRAAVGRWPPSGVRWSLPARPSQKEVGVLAPARGPARMNPGHREIATRRKMHVSNNDSMSMIGASSAVSTDGARIAFWSSGVGPPLVLVHGSMADHTTFVRLVPLLEPRFTVHVLDRRGRGRSDDGPDYAVEHEYADVAAVVDMIAERSGGPRRALRLLLRSHLRPRGRAADQQHQPVGSVRAGLPRRVFLSQRVDRRLAGLVAEGRAEQAVEEAIRERGGASTGRTRLCAPCRRGRHGWPRHPPSPGSCTSTPRSASIRRVIPRSPCRPCCCSASAAQPDRSGSSKRSTQFCRTAESQD